MEGLGFGRYGAYAQHLFHGRRVGGKERMNGRCYPFDTVAPDA